LEHAQQAMSLDPEFRQNMGPLVQALLVEKEYALALQEVERLRDKGIPIPPMFMKYLQKQANN